MDKLNKALDNIKKLDISFNELHKQLDYQFKILIFVVLILIVLTVM